MEAAEGFVLLADCPGLAIEFHLDDMLSVGPVVLLICDHIGRDYAHVQRYLEKVRPVASTLLRTALHMVNECLRWEEDITELALHR